MLFSADFETTTKEDDCRVWAWASSEIGNKDNFKYGNSIDSFMLYVENQPENSTFYFHNLKFDGEFLMVWLFENGFEHVKSQKDLKTKSFSTLISDMGQFYSIKVVFEKKGKKTKYAKFIDSLKIIPFSVEEVARAFNLPISKLEIDYNAEREIGHVLTNEELSYIKNDVEIVAEALNVLFNQNLTKITQGSNALFDYQNTVSFKMFKKWFPTPDYDSDVRQAYKGGFTYLNPDYKNKDVGEGLVLDVNSLYPSVMRNCILPYGDPIYFEGEYQTDKLYPLYVQMLTCQFELKEGFIPTIQIKNNLSFIPTQYLTSSADITGALQDVTLCLTSVDLELFKKHYKIYNPVYHSGWKFKGTTGLFTKYIDKWNKVKMESTLNGNKSLRTLSKLMLNALYGKFSLNPIVKSKIPYYEEGVIKYKQGEPEERDPLYIGVGAFITAWARHKTITSAQMLKKCFMYADTDSLHLRLDLPEDLKRMSKKEIEKLTTADLNKYGLEFPEEFEIDPVKLGAWKVESKFNRARFIRQKCYIEDWNTPDTWNTEKYNPDLLNITCAGMPPRCYDQVTWENFHEGQKYGGKLVPKHVVGGIVLTETEFTILKS